MGDAGFYRGISQDQDGRFADKQKKLLRKMSFPPEFDEKVDFNKVNLDVLRPWIADQVIQYLGFEDEIVLQYIYEQLEEQKQKPDPKLMQINITGFLERNTKVFMLDLWKLVISASKSDTGVPEELLKEKKMQLQQQREEADRVSHALSRERHKTYGSRNVRSSEDNTGPDSRRRSKSPEIRHRSRDRSPPRRRRKRSPSDSRDRRQRRSRSPARRRRSRSRDRAPLRRRRSRSRDRPRRSRDRRRRSRSRSRERPRKRSRSHSVDRTGTGPSRNDSIEANQSQPEPNKSDEIIPRTEEEEELRKKVLDSMVN